MDDKYKYDTQMIDVISNKIVVSGVYALHSKAKLNESTNINSHKVKSTVQKMRMEFGGMDTAGRFFETARGNGSNCV